jgi:RNA polymerase sigma-70 factor, ECF subfamily
MMIATSTTTVPHLTQPAPELIEKIKAGEHTAFGVLVRDYQAYAFALAMRFSWDSQEADDIVQESFVRVWKHIGSYRPEQRFTTWLYAIVARLSIDHLRSKSRWRQIVVPGWERRVDEEADEELSPEDVLDNKELLAKIRKLVEQLPRTQRLVFTLRDLQDLSMEEVAEVTGMPTTSIKANLCHARRRIRVKLSATMKTAGR